MTVTVANIRTFRGDSRTAALVDRTTAYGNPFKIVIDSGGHRGVSRHQACDRFEDWWAMPSQAALREQAWKELHAVEVLLCHCHPQRCHALTIAKWLMKLHALEAVYHQSMRDMDPDRGARGAHGTHR